MAETHETEGQHGPTVKIYMAIFAALVGFTLVSFVVNYLVREQGLAAGLGFTIILLVAIAKAALVGMYYMHLKYDWGRLYFMIIPVAVLAVMMIIVLLPDMVLGWSGD